MALNVRLLESSFAKVKPQQIAFSASFYQKLFAHHPELKPLFKNADAKAQERKLIISLAIIVENLHNPQALSAALKSLGAYHREIGTLREHYPFVGQALIETFAEYLGKEWTSEIQQTWLDAYNLICETMLEGAKNPNVYLGGELTFYEWLDLYGESSSRVREAIADTTHFKYRHSRAARELLGN
ncbi:globin family protein [Myxosarcina sp. GI1]|uniref:globin family protein n=1 Tax=Myxosarcina sp. GI1 TaxID=1541065 RepID=UPI000565C3CB|nr:globin family protein [Myxosarcina sp. GI1]